MQSVPQLMPAGVETTVPTPEPALVMLSVLVPRVNVAVTFVAAVIVTVHVPVPVQPPPLQPVNVEPAFGSAVSVMVVPSENASVQSLPQLIPLGALTTLPTPVPAREMLSVCVARPESSQSTATEAWPFRRIISVTGVTPPLLTTAATGSATQFGVVPDVTVAHAPGYASPRKETVPIGKAASESTLEAPADTSYERVTVREPVAVSWMQATSLGTLVIAIDAEPTLSASSAGAEQAATEAEMRTKEVIERWRMGAPPYLQMRTPVKPVDHSGLSGGFLLNMHAAGPSEQKPWEVEPALKGRRLALLAQVAIETRHRAFSEAHREEGDTNWGLGCKAHERFCYALCQLAEGSESPWLRVRREGLSFTTFVENVPVRVYRGLVLRPPMRHIRSMALEKRLVDERQLALFADPALSEAPWFWMMAVETFDDGRVRRVVFFQVDESGNSRNHWEPPPDGGLFGDEEPEKPKRKPRRAAEKVLPLPS